MSDNIIRYICGKIKETPVKMKGEKKNYIRNLPTEAFVCFHNLQADHFKMMILFN